MALDALVVLGTVLGAIFCGFLFGAGAPMALTVAFDHAREGFPRSRPRARRPPSPQPRYPYR